jgi:FMN phosphatase YigB (HAD superfamily)
VALQRKTKTEIEALPAPVVYRFSPVSRMLREAKSRIELVKNPGALDDVLRAAFRASGASVLSLDVFDTFLLRDNQSEARRFWELSKKIHEALSAEYQRAAELMPEDFLMARADGMRISYRTRKPVKGCCEGALTDVVKIARRALALPAEADQIFIDTEIAYEASVLTLNRALIDLVRQVKAEGGRVILVSDMYLSSDHIAAILERVDADAARSIDAIYSSCDLVISKRSGRIFREIARRMEAESSAFFHVGDSLMGDVAKPREAGWSSLHFPVSDAETREREADLDGFVADMRERGLSVADWAKV